MQKISARNNKINKLLYKVFWKRYSSYLIIFPQIARVQLLKLAVLKKVITSISSEHGETYKLSNKLVKKIIETRCDFFLFILTVSQFLNIVL